MRKSWEEVPVPFGLHYHAPAPHSDRNLPDAFLVLVDSTRGCVFTYILPLTSNSEGSVHGNRVSVVLLSSNKKFCKGKIEIMRGGV